MSDLGSALLDELDVLLARFVVFPSVDARVAVALWTLHAHAVDAFESTPRLALLSPEKGSGKTRTLEVLGLLVPDPIHAVNMSAAALYRLVKEKQPTLLLDEADSYLGNLVAKQHEDLRGLINAGHRRGATVYRGEVTGKTVSVVEFPAFAACALAGIGDLPDTILDRSIVIAMKRRAPDERVEAFRDRLVRPQAEELRARLAAWAEAHADALGEAWPEMPSGIVDRAADVLEPLIAIADQAGGDWPERARQAATNLNNVRAEQDPSLGVQLLHDCQRLFASREADRLTTETLLDALVALDESPWGDLRGKPLDARGLARRLRSFEVRPGDHRFEDGTRKGYRREDFHDAWTRYLPPVADVAHVAPPQGEKREGDAVALVEDEAGYVFSSISNNSHASNSRERQQGQHGQREAPNESTQRSLAPSSKSRLFPPLTAARRPRAWPHPRLTSGPETIPAMTRKSPRSSGWRKPTSTRSWNACATSWSKRDPRTRRGEGLPPPHRREAPHQARR